MQATSEPGQGNEPRWFNRVFPQIESIGPYPSLHWLQVLLYTILFSGVLFVLKQYNITPSSGITDLGAVFIPGFVLYSLAAHRYKAFILCLVFVACAYYIFSWISATAIVFLLSLTAYVIYAPYRLRTKYLYLALLAAMLILLRNSRMLYMPRVNIVVPFVAAILMFRVIILMYEVKHNKLPDNHWLKLSYFFCFPNLAFLFFPIIDYRTYVRSYHSAPLKDICNKALWYMLLGIMLIMGYKLGNHYLNMSYDDVHDIYGLLLLMLSKFILILKMVGLLIIGLSFIVMFGFNMPVLFGNFFLSTSFNNYWQRVNIYWKDFIVKIVYYPLYFKYRKKVKGASTFFIVLAILSSWVFHLYQRFWLTGSVPLGAQDFLYWFLLALLVANDARRAERLAKEEKKTSFAAHLAKGARFVLVFATMLTLWFLWNSESVPDFVYIMSKGLKAGSMQLVCIGAGIIVMTLCYALYLWSARANNLNTALQSKRRMAFSVSALLLLCLLWLAKPGMANNKLLAIVSAKQEMNKDDKTRKEVGYYSAITNAKNEDWEVGLEFQVTKKQDMFSNISVFTHDLLFQVLKPSSTIPLDNYTVVTNRWGFRDKDYPDIKPPNTFRIMMLGGSYEMGSGVSTDQMFEKITEARLNERYKGDPAIEIINFGMGAYTAVPQMEVVRKYAPKLHPDEILLFYHTDELRRATGFFARYISSGVPLEYDFLIGIKKAAGVRQSMSGQEIQSRLKPYMKDVTRWCYSQIDSMCKANNIRPVWVFMPTTSDELTPGKLSEVRDIAMAAGFDTYVLEHIFDGYDRTLITISEADPHPNALGHRLIANKLFNLLIDSTKHIIPIK